LMFVKEDIMGMLTGILDDSVAGGRLDPEDDLISMGLDSVKIINMIVLLEEKYGIEIKDEDLLFENFETVRKITELLERYLN